MISRIRWSTRCARCWTGTFVLDRNTGYARTTILAISMLDSLSRLMPNVVSPERICESPRRCVDCWQPTRGRKILIRIGAYQKGADPILDKAIEVLPALNSFLQQRPDELPDFADSLQRLNGAPELSMPYRFTLSPVLKLRESIEDRDLHLLEQTRREIAHYPPPAGNLARSSAQEKRGPENASWRRECQPLIFGSLKKQDTSCGSINARWKSLWPSCNFVGSSSSKNYETAKRGREVLSDLRDRQREIYEAIAVRSQQRITDDLFLIRHQKK